MDDCMDMSVPKVLSNRVPVPNRCRSPNLEYSPHTYMDTDIGSPKWSPHIITPHTHAKQGLSNAAQAPTVPESAGQSRIFRICPGSRNAT